MFATNEQVPSPTLLIVEDEFMIANDLRRILEKAGYRIVGLVSSVPEAKETVEQHNPDIVLLDIFLDGNQTGVDLAYWLRERDTPFVYLSANLTDSILTAAKQTQPFGFLTKPFRDKDVLTTLEIARYRHAHSEEAKLRQQQALQIAVNNSIISIQDRQQLCLAIADQINQLVPFSFFNLLIVRPVDNYRYLIMLHKVASKTFKQINLTTLLQRELQEEDQIYWEQEMKAIAQTTGVLYTHHKFKQLCEHYETVRSWQKRFGIQSLALFPIQVNTNVFTTLTLAQTEVDGITQKDYDLVKLIIPQIALALTNLLAYEEIEARRQLKTTELAIVTAFRNGKDLSLIVAQIARSLNDLLPFDLLTIYQKGKANQSITAMAVQKEDGQFKHVKDVIIPQWILSDTALWPTYPTIQERRLEDKFQYAKSRQQNVGIKSSILVPITSKDQIVALMDLGSQASFAFTQKDGQLLEEISGPLAMALENFSAFEHIKELSNQLEREKTYLTEEIKTSANFEEIIGNSAAMLGVFNSISQVALTDSTVLILGETGTGKELIARAVHNRSNRKNRPMVKVNCAALPTQLIESELFGHERGSFTGALEKRIGKFELADGGTIFLDEIGELPVELQSKLLRVIQEKEIERLGGKGPINVNVRIIAATNRNLEKEVAANQFRPDLYYRLNVFPIKLPALRERKEDLLALSLHFLQRLSKKLGKPFNGIANSSIQKMHNYSWPGNIRELEHVLERAAIVSQTSTLEITEPLQSIHSVATSINYLPPLVEPLQDTMRAAILAALAQSGNRIRGQGGAAELLHIKPTTLEARMKKLNISPRF